MRGPTWPGKADLVPERWPIPTGPARRSAGAGWPAPDHNQLGRARRKVTFGPYTQGPCAPRMTL